MYLVECKKCTNFFSSLRHGDQSTVFCIVYFDFTFSRSPKIRDPFALVCRCYLADIKRSIFANLVFKNPGIYKSLKDIKYT